MISEPPELWYDEEGYERFIAQMDRLERQFNELLFPTNINSTHSNINSTQLTKEAHAMKMNDAFPGKYLRADDVEDEPILTIKDLQVEEVGPKKEEKYILYFREEPKGLVLNKTNWKTIDKILGTDDTDEWFGKKIQLYSGTAQFQGEEVDAIRVRTNKGKKLAAAAALPAAEEEYDDKIPF